MLKCFAMIKSSEVVLLYIFKVIWSDPVIKMFDGFYTIPYSFWVFFIGFKVCFKVVFFTKAIQSYYLISVVFKFLMKNILTGGVRSLAKLFVQLISYIGGFNSDRRHPRFWGVPFHLSFRGWKWRIFII